jgi:hypothetical protein
VQTPLKELLYRNWSDRRAGAALYLQWQDDECELGGLVSGQRIEIEILEKKNTVGGRVGVYCGAVHLSEPKSWVTDNALYIYELKDDFDVQYLVVALRVANLNQYAGRAAQPLVSGNRIYPVPILVPRFRYKRSSPPA